MTDGDPLTGADPLADVVERLWVAHRARVGERLVLVAAALAGAPGSDPAAAAVHAHALAGALGTYGRPGSGLLKQAERALRDGRRDDTLAADVGRLRAELQV